MRIKRVYHRFEKWEEVAHGMWSDVASIDRAAMLQKAIKFTGNALLYGSWMQKVIRAWPISCEHNLTDINQNRKAWVGHAACCFAIGCPEHITRHAWGFLSQTEQDDANMQASLAIKTWEYEYTTTANADSEAMAGARLSRGYPGRGSAKAGSHEQSSFLSALCQSIDEK